MQTRECWMSERPCDVSRSGIEYYFLMGESFRSRGFTAAKRRTNAADGVSRGEASRAEPAPKGRKKSHANVLSIIPIAFAGEIRPNDSIADHLLNALRAARLRLQSGDILVVKHKIVSKSEGQIVDLSTIHPTEESISWAKQYDLDPRVIELALHESRSIVRRRNGVLITETHHGFLCANSGIDVSNVDGGRHALLLPEDPDRSAANLHRALKKKTGIAVPVIITDSFGRPWREGLTEVAIGIAGLKPLRDDRGQRDSHGYKLKASVEAIADELACAAGLVCGKLNRAPACLIRGYRYASGNGSARELLRPAANDLFR